MEFTERDIETCRRAVERNRGILESMAPDEEGGGWLDRPFDSEMRKALGRIDIQFFAHFYLPHHFAVKGAPLHDAIFDAIEAMMNTPGRVNQVIAVFRGAGKSTIATLVTPLWCVCFALRHYIPIISDSYDQAKLQLASIKDELEHNERILEDFGSLQGQTWATDDIETKNDIKVVALGQGMKFRGRKFRQWRPDLIILDDIEDKKAVQSLTQRVALYQWFMGTVMRAGWMDTKTLVIGNKLHWDSLVTRLAKNPGFRAHEHKAVLKFHDEEAEPLWEQWRQIMINMNSPKHEEEAHAFFMAHQGEMMKGVEVAWPEVHPYEECMKIKVIEGEDVFYTEMQNEPTDPSTQYFKHYGTFKRIPHRNEDGTYEEWLVPWDPEANEGQGGASGKTPIPLNTCRLVAATDPSLGETVGGSKSAIVIAAKAPNNQLFVLVADKQYRLPDQIIRDMIRYMEEYPGIERWGIEAVQFQKFFKQVAAERSMEKGAKLPVVAVSTHNNLKVMRIQSLQPDLANDYILLNEDGQMDLKAEIRQFRPGGRDEGFDTLDALEMAKGLAADMQQKETAATTHVETFEFGKEHMWEGFAGHGAVDVWEAAELAAQESERRERIEREIKEGMVKDEPEEQQVYYPVMF